MTVTEVNMYKISKLSYRFPGCTNVLNNIDLSIEPGEFVLMSGPNGSGKSTLLKAMLGIIPEYSGGSIQGSILFANKPIQTYNIVGLSGRSGIVLQDPECQISNLSVWEEVTFGTCNLKYDVDKVVSTANWALKNVGLSGLEHRHVITLSGGQLQRLSIATLLAMRPSTLILDEPLANLDPLGVKSVVEALEEVKEYVDTIIVATHWLDPFMEIATRLVLIDAGMVVLDIPVDQISCYEDVLENCKVEVPQKIIIERKLRTLDKNFQKSLSSLKQIVPKDNFGSDEILKVEKVSYAYTEGEVSLSDISFGINRRSQVSIVGHNGSGKTTLARLLVGLREPSEGKILSKDIKRTMVMQKPSLGFLTETVEEELSYGLNVDRKVVWEHLNKFNLLQYKSRSPFNLSGGEQRSLALAIALLSGSEMIILDEPTAGLDAYNLRIFRDALSEFTGTVICITHDPRIVGVFTEEVIALKNGTLAYFGSVYRMPARMHKNIGYAAINPTVNFAIEYLDTGIPMSPEDLEVEYENFLP
jgi:energy-coupling factor transport system ATP-binding protein